MTNSDSMCFRRALQTQNLKVKNVWMRLTKLKYCHLLQSGSFSWQVVFICYALMYADDPRRQLNVNYSHHLAVTSRLPAKSLKTLLRLFIKGVRLYVKLSNLLCVAPSVVATVNFRVPQLVCQELSNFGMEFALFANL